MTYDYLCDSCGHKWDVIKSVRHIDDPENCEKCSTAGRRIITRTHFYGASDWNNQRYSPALGRVVNSSLEERKLAKERGYIEMGNECPNKTIDTMERDRERMIDKRRDEFFSTNLGEVR